MVASTQELEGAERALAGVVAQLALEMELQSIPKLTAFARLNPEAMTTQHNCQGYGPGDSGHLQG